MRETELFILTQGSSTIETLSFSQRTLFPNVYELWLLDNYFVAIG